MLRITSLARVGMGSTSSFSAAGFLSDRYDLTDGTGDGVRFCLCCPLAVTADCGRKAPSGVGARVPADDGDGVAVEPALADDARCCENIAE